MSNVLREGNCTLIILLAFVKGVPIEVGVVSIRIPDLLAAKMLLDLVGIVCSRTQHASVDRNGYVTPLSCCDREAEV